MCLFLVVVCFVACIIVCIEITDLFLNMPLKVLLVAISHIHWQTFFLLQAAPFSATQPLQQMPFLLICLAHNFAIDNFLLQPTTQLQCCWPLPTWQQQPTHTWHCGEGVSNATIMVDAAWHVSSHAVDAILETAIDCVVGKKQWEREGTA